MTKNEGKLIEIVDTLIDRDHWCDENCDCGECESCREIEETLQDYYKIKRELEPK